MWQRKFTGILGLWVVALAFIDFSSSLRAVLFVITGLAVAFLSFKPYGFVKSDRELIEDIEETRKEFGRDGGEEEKAQGKESAEEKNGERVE